MQNRMLARTIIMVSMLACAVSAASTQETRQVYEVRSEGFSGSAMQSFSTGMRVAAEAARLFSPVLFRKKGTTVEFISAGTLEFSGLKTEEVTHLDRQVLLRHEVQVASIPRLPKADKSLSVRFSLAELGRTGGEYASSPLLFAVVKAIRSSPYALGSAWIQSVKFDGKNFTIVVGLSRR